MSDFSKIAEELALTAKSARQLRDLVAPVEKQANSITDSLSGLAGEASDYLSKNPQLAEGLKYTLGGAAAGGLLGGASGLFAPKEKRNVGRSVLHGALAGAGMGGGGYLLGKSLGSRGSSGADLRQNQMLEAIDAYSNRPGFLGKVKDQYTHWTFPAIVGADLATMGLGAAAGFGPSGRPNTQTHFLSDLRKKLLENPKLLNNDEKLTQHFMNTLTSTDPNHSRLFGVARDATPETKLRQILTGRNVTLPTITVPASKGAPAQKITMQVTKDMLTPVLEQMPGKGFYRGSFGSAAEVLKKLPVKKLQDLGSWLQDHAEVAGGRDPSALTSGNLKYKPLPRPLQWLAAIEHMPRKHYSLQAALLKRLGLYGGVGLGLSALANAGQNRVDRQQMKYLIGKYLEEGGNPAVIPDTMKQQLGV